MAEYPIDPSFGRFIPPLEQESEVDTPLDPLPVDNMMEMADGSVFIAEIEDEAEEDNDFYANLAEKIDQKTAESITSEYIELLEKDKKSREKRDKQYEEGIRRTGMGDDAPGGAQFSGASRVVHPLLAEGCVDFSARAMKEVFPAKGPVRTQILGKASPEKLDRAERKRDYLNWQLTNQIREYRSELEQLLTQLPLGGSQYMKFWWDDRFERPYAEFIPVDNILLPFACSNFYTAQRATHVQDITEFEFRRRVENELYRDIDSYVTDETPKETASQAANDKIEGRAIDAYNEDGLRRVFEIYTYLELEDDALTGGKYAPYILTIDETTEEILAIYRNWGEDDDELGKLDWIVEYQFIPWRGAYGIGLPHLIGGISAALTGSLRALLDSAHINNAATMLKLKGARVSGQSTSVEVTQVAEIEGPAGIDDIKKIAMPMPFNPPSMVLFQLLGWLTDAGKGVVNTADEKIADASNQMPVGTALALIEQGSVTFSAIHARLHESQRKALEIICRLDYQHLEDEETVEELGELIVRREDFKTSTDILPVTDPSIFSESQRYAQNQAIMQLMATNPQLYDPRAVHARVLKTLRVDNIDEILPPPKTPQPINAVEENTAALFGTPIMAFMGQDHIAHIRTHLAFMADPLFGMNPLYAPRVLPPLIENVMQHIALLYSATAEMQGQAAASMAPMMAMMGAPQQSSDMILAQASTAAQQQIAPVIQQATQVIMQAKQFLQQMTPPMPPIQDPAAQAMLQASMAETQRKTEKDKADTALATQKLQMVAEEAARAAEHDASIEVLHAQTEDKKIAAEISKNLSDNETKLTVEAAKLHDAAIERAANVMQEHNRMIEERLLQGAQNAQRQMQNAPEDE